MKVAVTGASGYLGNYLCRALGGKVSHLKILVHSNIGDLTSFKAEIVRGDIRDKDTLASLLTDVDVVYHLAAVLSIGEKSKELVYEINVEGTRNLLEACKNAKVKRLVHFSTIKTLAAISPSAMLDETANIITHSPSAYDDSKAKAEKLILAAASDGLDVVILNPTAIIGPYDHQPSYLGQALLKIYNNRFPLLVTGGYDFVDVRDVIDAAIVAGTQGGSGERYILSGSWHSITEISRLTAKITGRKTPQFAVPLSLAQAGLPFVRLHDFVTGKHSLFTAEALDNLRTANKQISNNKARQVLGFNPRPLENTLSDTFAWFEQNKMT